MLHPLDYNVIVHCFDAHADFHISAMPTLSQVFKEDSTLQASTFSPSANQEAAANV